MRWLSTAAVEDVDRFEAEVRAALTAVVCDRDMSRVDTVLRRWHAIAILAAIRAEYRGAGAAVLLAADITAWRAYGRGFPA
jgi:uncharacterized protein DUF6247